ADGEAALYFRPHDVELVEGCGGCIAGVVTATRRVGAKRRVELEVGGNREIVEIEIPAENQAVTGSRLAFRPKYWRVFASQN
ncbi:TOBE-like domain-containing protein, partial [Salmonella enterica]|nr:TOBE-like domain-containing protein [Salmonella enterica]